MNSFIGKIPDDFPIEKITAPVLIHYSPTDPHTSPYVINKLVSMLPNVIDKQEINDVVFNHVDFIWGIHAHEIVYSRILRHLINLNT